MSNVVPFFFIFFLQTPPTTSVANTHPWLEPTVLVENAAWVAVLYMYTFAYIHTRFFDFLFWQAPSATSGANTHPWLEPTFLVENAEKVTVLYIYMCICIRTYMSNVVPFFWFFFFQTPPTTSGANTHPWLEPSFLVENAAKMAVFPYVHTYTYTYTCLIFVHVCDILFCDYARGVKG